jgi:hypothetical protein
MLLSSSPTSTIQIISGSPGPERHGQPEPRQRRGRALPYEHVYVIDYGFASTVVSDNAVSIRKLLHPHLEGLVAAKNRTLLALTWVRLFTAGCPGFVFFHPSLLRGWGVASGSCRHVQLAMN